MCHQTVTVENRSRTPWDRPLRPKSSDLTFCLIELQTQQANLLFYHPHILSHSGGLQGSGGPGIPAEEAMKGPVEVAATRGKTAAGQGVPLFGNNL